MGGFQKPFYWRKDKIRLVNRNSKEIFESIFFKIHLWGFEKAMPWSHEINTPSAHCACDAVVLNHQQFSKRSVTIYSPEATSEPSLQCCRVYSDEKLKAAYDFFKQEIVTFFPFAKDYVCIQKKRGFLPPCRELLVSVPSGHSPLFSCSCKHQGQFEV